MGLLDSLKKIAKVAAPIAGAGIASLLVPGSGFFAPAIGGGIGALFGGQKPGQALLTALTAGAGGKFLGPKLGGALGKFAAPVGAAIGAAPAAIAAAEQNELMKKMRDMYPNADDEQLQELVLRQTVKAPTNYQGFEDMQVQSELVPLNAASGGGVKDLRQSGGMSLGPGTEKSDSIPAMLSDGEFVMTSRAVRGIGNGSRKLGAKRLYDMMHKAENNATV
jgi:hypothetical protein